jgi:hypothetical protein
LRCSPLKEGYCNQFRTDSAKSLGQSPARINSRQPVACGCLCCLHEMPCVLIKMPVHLCHHFRVRVPKHCSYCRDRRSAQQRISGKAVAIRIGDYTC